MNIVAVAGEKGVGKTFLVRWLLGTNDYTGKLERIRLGTDSVGESVFLRETPPTNEHTDDCARSQRNDLQDLWGNPTYMMIVFTDQREPAESEIRFLKELERRSLVWSAVLNERGRGITPNLVRKKLERSGLHPIPIGDEAVYPFRAVQDQADRLRRFLLGDYWSAAGMTNLAGLAGKLRDRLQNIRGSVKRARQLLEQPVP